LSPKERRASGIGTLIFTVLALIFTGITAWLLAMMLSGTEYSKEPVRPVVVAREALSPLKPIREGDLRVVKVPESAVPEGAFAKVEDLLTTPPAMPIVQISAGEMVLKERLADPASGRGLASLVPDGMRAMVVRFDVAAALARLIYPGSTVDVLATLRVERLNTVVSRVVLQQIKVLAVGTDVDPAHVTASKGGNEYSDQSERKDTVATLLVTPEQAEQLTLAAREGSVDLILRSESDGDTPQTPGAQPEDLFPEMAGLDGDEGERSQREAVQRVLSRPRFRKPAAAPAVEVH